MSGKTWDELKAEDPKDMLVKFQRLNLKEANYIVWSLLILKEETMTRKGHAAVDDILNILGVNHER